MGWLGILADDLTGATDVASAVRAAGHRVVVTVGVPESPVAGADAVVVALTTRSEQPARAVGRSIRAAEALLAGGARVLYQKYCSTFDSTERGNIGPVGDALLALAAEHGGRRATQVHTPATPRVGRTVVDGQLFVHGVPLAESPMKDHPLTPMRDSDLVRLLAAQSARPVTRVRPEGVPPPGHVILDAATEADLDRVAAWALGLPAWPETLFGGAAGLAGALARTIPALEGAGAAEPGGADLPGRAERWNRAVPPGVGRPGDAESWNRGEARRLVIAGSCSARTREQVAAFSGPVVPVTADAVMTDPHVVDRVAAQVAGHLDDEPSRPVLVASTVPPDRASADQARWGADKVARAIEGVLGEVARRGVRSLGVTHVLVAGGETAGAVTAALGVRRLEVLDDVAPGVPWTRTPDGPALLLKSGNFGEPDLFDTAWETAP